MADLSSLHKICDWKLLSGSHDYPGPSGGTCINEAAIVAAGLKYRSFNDYNSMPKCFSPVLAGALMSLNDTFGDEDRQQLIKYVPLIAGSRDTNKIEIDRLEVLITSLSNLYCSLYNNTLKKSYPDAQIDLNIMDPYTRLAVIMRNWRYSRMPGDYQMSGTLSAELTSFAAFERQRLLSDGRLRTESIFDLATSLAHQAAKVVYLVDCTRQKELLDIIDEIRTIGKQPDALDTSLIFTRMSFAKNAAKAKENAA